MIKGLRCNGREAFENKERIFHRPGCLFMNSLLRTRIFQVPLVNAPLLSLSLSSVTAPVFQNDVEIYQVVANVRDYTRGIGKIAFVRRRWHHAHTRTHGKHIAHRAARQTVSFVI